jgi:DNA-directed RNA polymerase subunit RPC12/RpoP
MIKFKCASCDKAYQLPDNAAGRKARCKACGEAMVVPDAPDELFDDGTPAGDDLTALYGNSDSAGAIDHVVAAEDPIAFNPDVGFQHEPKQHRSSGPPKVFILAGAGGALALIVIVVVIVIVMGGDGKDADDNSDALAFDPNAAAPSGRVPTPSNGNTSDPDTPGDTDPEPPVIEPAATDPRLVPPDDESLAKWTTPVDSSATKRVAFRGLDFRVPEDWHVQFSTAEALLNAELLPGDAPPEPMRKYSDVKVLSFGVKAFTTITIRVTPRPEQGLWPPMYGVDRTTGEMLLCADLIAFSRTNNRFLTSPNGKMLNRLKNILHEDPLRHKRSVAYELLEPQAFYVHRDLVDEVEFGELFGGYRFVRISGLDLLGDYRTVSYFGYVGDLLVTAQIQFQSDMPGNLKPAEKVLRSAALLSSKDAKQLTTDDTTFQTWLKSKAIVFSEDAAPLDTQAGGPIASTDPDDTTPQTPSNPLGTPAINQSDVSPNGKPFAMDFPSDLNVISVTRTSVRTSPHADGTWLSMEVHKLAGLDRRESSPIASDRSTVLLRGRRIAMPAGVEVSDLATDHFTAKRLLYPKTAGAETRRVEYVIKDGPYLISVLGRFPVNDEARLAMLDEAAKSVQPIEGD